MGVGLGSGGSPYLLVVHFVGLGLLGWSIAEQRQLRNQVWELQATVEHHHSDLLPVSTSSDPPTPSPVGNPSSLPEFPEDSLRVPAGFKVGASGWLVGVGISALGFLLLALLLIGVSIWRARRFTGPIEEPGTPDSKHQLAQRQLAELRLRRHGFGKSPGPDRV